MIAEKVNAEIPAKVEQDSVLEAVKLIARSLDHLHAYLYNSNGTFHVIAKHVVISDPVSRLLGIELTAWSAATSMKRKC